MSRVVKDAGVRRKELLDTAMRLFIEVGYEHTSIEMITAAVGVSKGNFYHYFDSKQDLLAELATSWADELFEHAEGLIRTSTDSAAVRLGLLLRTSAAWKAERSDAAMAFARSLYSEENLRLRSKIMTTWMDRLNGLLADLIAEGAAEGSFDVHDPGWTADVLTSLWVGWADRHAAEMVAALEGPPELLPRIADGLAEIETAMERILGVTPGSLDLGFRGALDAFAENRPAASA